MTTTSILTEEQMTEVIEPLEEQMFKRQGFDRDNLRFEIANVNPVEKGTKYVEIGGQRYLGGTATDRAISPTTVGESDGSIDIVREPAQQYELARFTHGFTLMDEDQEVSNEDVAETRDAVLELFDMEADAVVFDGLKDDNGNVIKKSVLQWLKDNIPASRTIDASNFSGNVPANIIVEDAYSKVSGEFVTESWGMMVGKHAALSNFSSYEDSTNAQQTHWDLISTDANDGLGGVVEDTFKVPDNISLPTEDSDEDIKVTIDDIGSDEIFLLPRQAQTHFWQLYEEPSPTHRGPIMKEGFRERHEYRWRQGVVFDPHNRGTNATDAIHIKNVSSAF
jgi:hypothetical protein